MGNIFLMLYPVLESLGANGGSWGGMERSPKVGEIPKMGKICTQRSQNWAYLWPITIILLVNPSLTVTASLIWGLWGLQMAGDAWSPQMAVSEPPWLLVNPTGPN